MKTKTQEVITSAMGDLQDLMHIVQVCGFAAEARRVLTDISDVASVDAEFDATLSKRVDAHSEWMCHEDSLGVALRVVARQINDIHSKLEAAS